MTWVFMRFWFILRYIQQQSLHYNRLSVPHCALCTVEDYLIRYSLHCSRLCTTIGSVLQQAQQILQQPNIVDSLLSALIWFQTVFVVGASPEVIVHLLSSKCVTVLLYGLDSCPTNITELRSLAHPVTMAFMKNVQCKFY